MRQRGTTHLSDPPYGGYPMPKSRRKRLSAVDRVKKYDTVVSSGQSALKALLTVTGGAILVIASLLGHLRDKGPIPPHSVHLFGMSLSWFMWAVVLALLAYGSIFITNCSAASIGIDGPTAPSP